MPSQLGALRFVTVPNAPPPRAVGVAAKPSGPIGVPETSRRDEFERGAALPTQPLAIRVDHFCFSRTAEEATQGHPQIPADLPGPGGDVTAPMIVSRPIRRIGGALLALDVLTADDLGLPLKCGQ